MGERRKRKLGAECWRFSIFQLGEHEGTARRHDESAEVSRAEGREVLGAVVGATLDVLRTLLDREQDRTGVELPCEVRAISSWFVKMIGARTRGNVP